MRPASRDPRPTLPAGDSADVLDTSAAGPAAIRGGALRVVGYGAGVLLSVLSAALLFRHLGVGDGGRYVTITALVALAGGLTDVGLTTIGVREVALRAPAERAAFMRNLIGLRIALTATGVACATAFAAVTGFSDTLVLGTVIAGGALLLQAIQQTFAVGLMTEMRFGLVATADLVRQIVNVLCVVALVAAGASLLPFFAVNAPANLAALALTVWALRGTIALRPNIDVGEWVAMLRDTLAYAAATAVGAVYFRIAIVLVALIASATQTGYFGASFRAIEVLVVVPQLLVGSAFPILARAARDDRDRLDYSLGKLFDVCLILGVGTALLLAVGAPFVIRVVAGPEFAPAADVLRIQGVAVGLAFLAAGPSYGLLSLRHHRAVLVGNLAALAVSAALVPILASADGARGAAIATVVAEVVLTVVMVGGAARAGLPIGLTARGLARVLFAAGAALAAALAAPLPAVAQAAIAGVVYLAVLAALRGIPDEVIELLPGRRGANRT